MTKEQKAAILDAAIDRAYNEVDQIKGVDMDTQEFRTLLKNLTDMEWLLEKATGRCYVAPEGDVPAGIPKAPEPAPEPIENEAPTPAPEQNCMSKEDLRDRLSTYSNKYDSLDIAQIMADMGYSKLSEIPCERYAELLDKVKAEIGEVG